MFIGTKGVLPTSTNNGMGVSYAIEGVVYVSSHLLVYSSFSAQTSYAQEGETYYYCICSTQVIYTLIHKNVNL